jgi:hypothetical protein
LTPNIGVSASGDADSTTKSAIAPGIIEVRSGDAAALEKLSRDTAGSLNALDKIFDKKTVKEQQELAKVFGEEAFKIVGDMGLKEGSAEKTAIDAIVGGLMSELGGGSFASGAASSGITQLVMTELAKIKDPALLQWASAVVGAAAAKAVGGNAQTGASVAASQTKNNYLSHWQKTERQKAVDAGDWEKVAYWDAIDKAQDQASTKLGVAPGTDLNLPENHNLLQTVSKLGQEIAASPDFQNSLIARVQAVDSSILIAAGVLGTAVVVGTVTLYNYKGNWVKVGTGVAGGSATFNNAVKALNDIDILNFTIKSKHLDILNNTSGWNKFNVGTVDEANILVNSIINSAKSNGSLIKNVAENPIGTNGQQSFKVLIDAGKVIGTKGETAIRIVYDELGNIWTVFPDKLP